MHLPPSIPNCTKAPSFFFCLPSVSRKSPVNGTSRDVNIIQTYDLYFQALYSHKEERGVRCMFSPTQRYQWWNAEKSEYMLLGRGEVKRTYYFLLKVSIPYRNNLSCLNYNNIIKKVNLLWIWYFAFVWSLPESQGVLSVFWGFSTNSPWTINNRNIINLTVKILCSSVAIPYIEKKNTEMKMCTWQLL